MAAPEVPDWTRVVLLSGIDPSGNPITIAVDANGYLIALIKGEYSGTLKNVAVDASGRMIMIPTDPADIWGNAISMGNAELAATFGFAHRFDHRGSVYLADSFENGLGIAATGTGGTLAAVSIISHETSFGGMACKLTGGSDGAQNAYLEYLLPKPSLSKVGLEASFRVGSDVNSIILRMRYYDGTNLHVGNIQYITASKKWQYTNSEGNWTDLQTSADLFSLAHLFHTAKLVIDPANNKYVRGLITGAEVDMSTLSLQVAADATSPILDFLVEVVSDTGKNGWIYVDNVIITQNEPT